MNGEFEKAGSPSHDYRIPAAPVNSITCISIINPEIRTAHNMSFLFMQTAVNGFTAFGMAFAVLAAGIDLSAVSVLSLNAVPCAGMIKASVTELPAVPITLASGVIIVISRL